MTPEELKVKEEADALAKVEADAAKEQAKAAKAVSTKNKTVMTPEELKVKEEADALAKVEADAAKEQAKAAKAKKKTIADLKPTDDVVVVFKNPVAVSEDGENSIAKEQVKQHVKYAYWMGLKKDGQGNPTQSTLRGAKLFGYVDDSGKVIEFEKEKDK